ncbi:hypothetical protein ACTXL6_21685, partial [Brachybacterium tyrofermentans]|uniref:hypothetical protein n=1 Tax=Brachybacterium tyrofermentans TaxID=47848 RepID=UPI003FD60A88
RPGAIQAVEEFEETVEALKRRYDRVLWPLLFPKAEDIYRWRMQLECGCVREVFTRGKDSYPDEHSDTDPLTDRPLPMGEYWCTDHRCERPFREVVEWVEREVKEFPADPEEPQHGMDPEVWAVIRHPEPHSSAFWRVRLACDHFCRVPTDLDFTTGDEPRTVSIERRDEMRSELEESWATHGEHGWPEAGPQRDHMRRMLDLRMPRPEPEQECSACAFAKRVTGYSRIGWLMSPPKPATPTPAKREKVAVQLAKAEAEVERLKRRLEGEG